MHDLARVRAEIKSWEREFVSRHGRDPSVQDIKDDPPIAERYKLYKKLSKAPRLPQARPASSVAPLPGFNPFSPVKNKKPATTPSPEPSAVSRARKRLRGEPVSPSPCKPKRQRVRSQAACDSNSEHELPHNFNSFVADSPVKAPVGGKSFELLFDDALPALPLPNKPLGSFATELDFPMSHSVSADSTLLEPRLDLGSKGAISGREHRVNRTQGKISSQIFPTKDRPPAPSHKSFFQPVPSETSQPKTSTKRALDDDGPVSTPSIPPQSHHLLIPPSPPPQDSASRDAGKGRAKATVGRKKPRVEDQDSDDGLDSPGDILLKVATVNVDRGKHARTRADNFNWDPLLHLRTRNHDSAAKEHVDANHHAPGTFSVDLPDKLRRVLAISPSRSDGTEERVVRGLLYGDRVGHYNPCRGGDIWDAGETDDGALGDAETEDDWEGEPIPWEVGEL